MATSSSRTICAIVEQSNSPLKARTALSIVVRLEPNSWRALELAASVKRMSKLASMGNWCKKTTYKDTDLMT